jgi:hypothetical protein
VSAKKNLKKCQAGVPSTAMLDNTVYAKPVFVKLIGERLREREGRWASWVCWLRGGGTIRGGVGGSTILNRTKKRDIFFL